jgi:hypothetical protein
LRLGRQRPENTSEQQFILRIEFAKAIPKLRPTYGQVGKEYAEKESSIGDPTTLIVRRGRPASDGKLGAVSAIFDAQEIGLILIGMPGLEN